VPASREGTSDVWRLTFAGTEPAAAWIEAESSEVEPSAEGGRGTATTWAPVVVRGLRVRAEPYAVAIPRASVLRGRVLVGGRPASAQVFLQYWHDARASPIEAPPPDAAPFHRWESTRTDEEGRFAFEALPAGAGTLRIARGPGPPHGGPPGYDRWGPADFALPGPQTVAFGQDRDVVIDVEPSSALRLDLRWPHGMPLPEEAASDFRGYCWSRDFWSGVDSQVSALGLEEGVLKVIVLPLAPEQAVDVLVHCDHAWCLAKDVVPRPEPHLRDLVPAARVRGRVLDARGRPESGVDVYVANAVETPVPPRLSSGVRGRTDAAGRFDLRLPVGGRCTLRAVDGDRRSVPRVVEANGPPVDLTLVTPSRVTGRVVGRSDEPLHGFYVRVVAPGLADGAPTAQCSTDGFFAAEWPADGPARLDVRHLGNDPRTATLEVPGEGMEDVVLRLAPGATVTGFVRDAAGRPVATAVTVRGEWTWAVTQSGRDGRFAIGGFLERDLEVFVRLPDGRLVSRPADGGEIDLVLPGR
jgi:hypothetical protein